MAMPEFKTPPRLPAWLILLAIFIIFGKLLAPLIPLLVLFLVLWRFRFFDRFQEKMQHWRKQGFDISAFQQHNTDVSKTNPKAATFSTPFFAHRMPDFQFRPQHIFGLIGLLIIAFIIIDGLVSVPAGHVAVIYDRGRGVLEREMPEGLHLKIPFWQVATIMDTRLQAYTMSVATNEGQLVGDDSIEALRRMAKELNSISRSNIAFRPTRPLIF